MDDAQLNRVGVVINPKSGRGRGKGQALADQLNAHRTNLDLCVLSSFAELYPALSRMAGNGVDTLFISSGDGTVQAMQTWIAESGQFKTLPKLCLLPHGTTNMTAADLGFKRRNINEQANFITDPHPRETRQRHTVKVCNPLSGQPQHGMFFGTGAVSEATHYCQVAFNDKGVGGNVATFATLATVIAKSVFLAPNPQDPNRFDKPYDMHVTADGTLLCEGPQLMMLATTLDKLILNTRPFWGGASGPLRTTIMPYPVPSIVRWLLPIMYGSEQRRAPPGAVSKAVQHCEVTSPTRFVLDGEFYDAPADAPLRLEAGPCFNYIVA